MSREGGARSPGIDLPGRRATEAGPPARARGTASLRRDLRHRCGNGWYGGCGSYRAICGPWDRGENGLPDPRQQYGSERGDDERRQWRIVTGSSGSTGVCSTITWTRGVPADGAGQRLEERLCPAPELLLFYSAEGMGLRAFNLKAHAMVAAWGSR